MRRDSRAAIGGTITEVRPGRRLFVAVHDRGADTTVFLIHGGGGNADQWRFQWRFLQQLEVNLVAFDAVGHGSSPRPGDPGGYGGAELMADLQAVFARHSARRNVVVAHSFGARLVLAWLVARQASGEAPDVESLVLLGAAPLGALRGALIPGWLGRLPLPLLELARPLLARRFGRLAWHPGADPALIRAEQRATRHNTLAMMQAIMAGAPAVSYEQLAALGQRVVILAGAQDGLVPDAASARLCASLGHARLERLADCGHQIMMERPAETNAAIASVLAHPDGVPAS